MIKEEEGYFAQCPKNREVIVTGKTKKIIRAELKNLIEVYVEACPDVKKRFYNGDKMMKVKFIES